MHTYMFHLMNRNNKGGEYGKVRLQDDKSDLFPTYSRRRFGFGNKIKFAQSLQDVGKVFEGLFASSDE